MLNNKLMINTRVNKLILILSIIFCSVSSLAQEGFKSNFTKITYTMSYKMDSLDNTDKKNIEEMELLYNDSLSIFQSVGIGLIDSLNYVGKKSNTDYNVRNEKIYSTIKRPRIYYSIFRKANKIEVFDTYKYGGLRSDGYNFYTEQIDFDWKITENTDSLYGYFVQQAYVNFGGREWEAWFTPDIPISSGPYKFYGLPGLILNIKDKTNTWEFSIQTILSNVSRPVFDKKKTISDLIKTKKLNFFNNRKNYFENRTLIDEQTGDIIVPSTEARQKSIEQDKKFALKNNNWIEL